MAAPSPLGVTGTLVVRTDTAHLVAQLSALRDLIQAYQVAEAALVQLLALQPITADVVHAPIVHSLAEELAYLTRAQG